MERNRKEYMRKYYLIHKAKLIAKTKKRYRDRVTAKFYKV